MTTLQGSRPSRVVSLTKILTTRTRSLCRLWAQIVWYRRRRASKGEVKQALVTEGQRFKKFEQRYGTEDGRSNSDLSKDTSVLSKGEQDSRWPNSYLNKQAEAYKGQRSVGQEIMALRSSFSVIQRTSGLVAQFLVPVRYVCICFVNLRHQCTRGCGDNTHGQRCYEIMSDRRFYPVLYDRMQQISTNTRH